MNILRWFKSKFEMAPLNRVAAVTCDDQCIKFRWARGSTASVTFDDIQRVLIRTTDQGPFDDDAFFVIETADSNFVGYNNPEYDRLVDEARTETAPGKRVAAWQEVEKMAHEEVPYIPFGFTKFIYLVKPYVKGFSADLLGPTRFEIVEIAR